MNTKREYERQSLAKINKRRVAAAIALLLLLPLAAWAGGVVTSSTEAALRAAMAGGGVVTFACDGTITLASTITNVSDTRLDGSRRHITISGNKAVRVFYANSNVSFTVVNLTIADGKSQGGSGILNLGGTLILTGVTFRSNTASVWVSNDNLSPQASGGAIFNRGGTANATNCSFTYNSAWIPAALGTSDPALGGAIYNSGALILDLCTLTGNSAIGGHAGSVAAGGAIFNQGTLTIGRTTLCGNAASGGSIVGYGDSGGEARGAAICNLGSMVTERSLFSSNALFGGTGGNGASGGTGTVWFPPPNYGTMGATGGAAYGGALFVGGPSSLANCTLTGNQARGGPGGAGGNGAVFFDAGGDRYWWLSPGWSGGSGGAACGAVYDATGALRLTNCTIAFNSSDGGLGGYGGMGTSSGSPGGNGMAAGGLQTTYGISANCLLAGNSPIDCTGSLADAGHNLSSDASCAFTNIGSMNNTDPRLGPLANNGGPTLTMALLPGSPAIDAGNTSLAPATDQRGFSRPAGLAADIGAFEYGSVMSPVALSRSGATGLNILATGNPGRSCRLLSSPDLSSWVPLATNQFGSDGTILFNLNSPPGSACRFYRLVTP